MPDYDDDYQNRYYTEDVFTEEQLSALDSVVNTDTFWDQIEPPEDDEYIDEMDF